jgi:[protein-PII] uridylyltransferase
MIQPLAHGAPSTSEPRLEPAPGIDAGRVRALIAPPGPADAQALTALARERLEADRLLIREAFVAGGPVDAVLHGHSRLIDGLLQGLMDQARARFPLANPTTGEQLALVAVGGYGRGELAPYSDVDLLFLHPYKRTPHAEQMVEFLLYRLWDLGLQVGHATRSVGECVRAAKGDPVIATNLLEARFLWGHAEPYLAFQEQFRGEVLAGREAGFVEAKLQERDARHQKVGDSRYLLEPNVKEGKGGLRDLHTLLWVGRALHGVGQLGELVQHGVFDRRAARAFSRAQRFLWTVRCHLHYLTGRAEERLTFDLQPEVAERMGFRDRGSSRGVERFMKRYYLVAKEVGGLTRILCAALEEQLKRRPGFLLGRLGLGRRRVEEFVVQRGRVGLALPDLLERRPERMLRLFHLAQERGLDIHPEALRSVTQNLKRLAALREDPDANRLFLEMLTSRRDPYTTLVRLNEAGVLGRLVPEFGRIVAQMQYDLYHVYTVDEHTIRAIGELHRIEAGESRDELPLASRLLPKLQSRTELYVATFLHDIGKGRAGNHSEIGARIAQQVCPRLGLGRGETETVAWLVRHHLLLSETALKRDLEDPKTIQDLVEVVQSPERLRLLLVLTAADIRAVGPQVWNGWKGQLLRELYHEAEAVMQSGDIGGRRRARIEAAKAALRAALPSWSDEDFAAYADRHDPRYWLGFGTDTLVRHAGAIAAADWVGRTLTLDFHVDGFRARTEVLLYAADHPGLFMKLAGALAVSGASIVDAHLFTTVDGMAVDSLGIQDAESRGAVEEPARLARIRLNVERAFAGELDIDAALEGRRTLPRRADVFTVQPRVLIDNRASRTHSLIEVNGRDRPGLLYELTRELKALGLSIASAHIATYGERAVDVFYVKDVFGLKITHGAKIRRIRTRLLDVLARDPACEPIPA